ncbi:MAG TPA: DUF4442 domain-containing protein [bacterium]|nr:DUF4442 domain-containing protein [bacterium]
MGLPPQILRVLTNFYPAYLFSRTVVKSVSPDWREIVVVIKKSLWNRNYVGTIFGGTLYAAADPFLMIMLIKILGIEDYIIWDKGAEIDFKKPGRSDITFRFRIMDTDLRRIKSGLRKSPKIVPEFLVEGVDAEGDVCVAVKKRIYIRRKDRLRKKS